MDHSAAKRLRILLISFCCAIALAGSLRAAEPMNVLFIVVDDLNTRLGCYGESRIHSPNMDALAVRGVRFDRAYCQYPSCGPSRASVLTGLRPIHTGVVNNQTHFRKQFPGIVTLPQLFRQHGYFVARAGKVFHQANPTDIGTSGLDDAASWQQVVNPRGRDKDEEDLLTVYTPDLPLPDRMSFLRAGGTDQEQTDGKVADAAIQLIRENKDRPFFVAAGFYRPHIPYIAPKQYFDLYDVQNTALAVLPKDYRKQVPASALASTPVWPNFGTTRQEARECIVAYDACVSFVDAQIGRLIQAVETMGIIDRTMIVLWGDHGYHLGEHGLWRKNSMFEESTRAPLIIDVPGYRKPNQTCRRIVEFVDIYPTVAELAGLPIPPDVDGVSLLPLLKDTNARWDRHAYSEVHFRRVSGYSVRTPLWRYTAWGPQGSQGAELYNVQMDFEEMNNLARDDRYKRIVDRLHADLMNHFDG